MNHKTTFINYAATAARNHLLPGRVQRSPRRNAIKTIFLFHPRWLLSNRFVLFPPLLINTSYTNNVLIVRGVRAQHNGYDDDTEHLSCVRYTTARGFFVPRVRRFGAREENRSGNNTVRAGWSAAEGGPRDVGRAAVLFLARTKFMRRCGDSRARRVSDGRPAIYRAAVPHVTYARGRGITSRALSTPCIRHTLILLRMAFEFSRHSSYPT